MLYTTALLEVRARLQELTPDFWLDNELYRAINEGVIRFSQEEKWPYLYTVVSNGSYSANATTFALTAGVSYERHFNMLMTFSGDTRPRAPKRVHPSEGYKLRLTYHTTASEPLAYYIASEAMSTGAPTATVRFVPAVNRAATIEYQYIRDPVTVAAPTTESLDIPEEYAMGVCAYAAGHAFLKELDFSKKADEQFALYQKAVADAKRESRKVTPDSGLVWGGEQPQYGFSPVEGELYYSIPDTLGP